VAVLEIRRIVEESYTKDGIQFNISSSAEETEQHQWTPKFMVIEILTGIISTRTLEQIFATQSEAETYAHHAARQWIDNGRPGLDVKP